MARGCDKAGRGGQIVFLSCSSRAANPKWPWGPAGCCVLLPINYAPGSIIHAHRAPSRLRVHGRPPRPPTRVAPAVPPDFREEPPPRDGRRSGIQGSVRSETGGHRKPRCRKPRAPTPTAVSPTAREPPSSGASASGASGRAGPWAWELTAGRRGGVGFPRAPLSPQPPLVLPAGWPDPGLCLINGPLCGLPGRAGAVSSWAPEQRR